MFDSLRKYAYDRRRGLLSAAAFVGGSYLAGHYALKRLEEVRERLIEDKTAKENMRNRFIRNQEDCIFTSQALVPTFGNQILEQLDVEALTLQIQRFGKTNRPRPDSLSMPSVTSDDSHSEAASSPVGHRPVFPSQDVSGSWADEFSSSLISLPENLPLPPVTPTEGSPQSSYVGLQLSQSGATDEHASDAGDLSASIYAPSSTDADSQSVVHISDLLAQSDFRRSASPSPPPVRPKTKTELWKELRTMTFTRSLTLVYTLVLLTLQTHVQLNLLASFKYVQSVVEMEAEQSGGESVWSGLLPPELESLLSVGGPSASSSAMWRHDDDDSRARVVRITELTERKYLTMNWWLLNVGWKVVMERVHDAVSEVFDRVPLKSELTSAELREKIMAVRQKVEREVPVTTQSEGEELTEEEQAQLQGAVPSSIPESRRTDFLPMLLPLTPATEQQTLLSGGLSPADVLSSHPSSSAGFRSLMDQSAKFIRSKDFDIVFDKAMDCCTDLFTEELDQEVFGGPDVEGGEKRIKLAAVLPPVAKWSHLAVNAMPNELIEGISRMPEVSAFSAIIFASYEERLRY